MLLTGITDLIGLMPSNIDNFHQVLDNNRNKLSQYLIKNDLETANSFQRLAIHSNDLYSMGHKF